MDTICRIGTAQVTTIIWTKAKLCGNAKLTAGSKLKSRHPVGLQNGCRQKIIILFTNPIEIEMDIVVVAPTPVSTYETYFTTLLVYLDSSWELKPSTSKSSLSAKAILASMHALNVSFSSPTSLSYSALASCDSLKYYIPKCCTNLWTIDTCYATQKYQ